MSAEKPMLVVNMADVRKGSLVEGPYAGTSFGHVNFEPREKVHGWVGTEATSSSVNVVPPGTRAPLFKAMHSTEEVGFIVSGSGEYHAGALNYPVRQGDFLLAPEGASGKFEVENTGSAELIFISFRDRGYQTNLIRRDWARSVIEAYIQRRWVPSILNWEGYEFDGHVLTTFNRGFTMLITYDQFGSIWVSGRRLPEKAGESIEGYVDRIVAVERELELARERAPEKV